MFKSFAASLLPLAALARGDNDGTSRENASTLSFTFAKLDGVVVTLHHYNKSGEAENVFEFHGDTQFTSTDGHYSNIRYGWCVSLLPNTVVAEGEAAEGEAAEGEAAEGEAAEAEVETLNWDCQIVQTNVDPLQNIEKDGIFPVYNGEFKRTTDGIWTGAAADFTNATLDESTAADPENSWNISSGKSHKRCKEDDSVLGKQLGPGERALDPPSNFVTCPAAPANADEGDTALYGVDMHFFRNFDTASNQDMKLMLDAEPAAAYKIFAFAQNFKEVNFTGEAQWKGVSDEQTIIPVSAVFKANLKAAQQAAEDAAQKEKDDAAEAEKQATDDAAKKEKDDAAAATKKEADATKEDGAMQITAHATAVLAAVYALAM